MTLADEHAMIADLLRASRKCSAASLKALQDCNESSAREYGDRANRMRAAAEAVDPMHLAAAWHVEAQ